jgi:AcrR family transcriptional regulator
MAEVAVQDGYPAATVARVIAHAGVSRPTFYDYFADRQACFLAVHRELAAELLERVRAALAAEGAERSVHAGVAALVEFARTEPLAALLLMHETATVGGEALKERDRTIAELTRIVERARSQAPPSEPTPDVFLPALIGSVYRLLALRLRRGERDLISLARDLEGWLAAYARPTREHRWGTLEPGPALEASPFVPNIPLYPPPPLPSGRAGLTPGEVGYNHRERILHACLQVSSEKGYAASTIADITAVAHIDRRVFYKHFRDKQDAFQATLEHAFQQTIATSATAFFSAPSWPERVWEAGHAFTQLLATNPPLARFAFIEAYTLGPTAVHRFEDLRSAYTIFLQEGRQQPRAGIPPPTDTALEAIAAIAFEITYDEIRRGHARQLASLLPHVAHLCLTPFIGTEAAENLIDSKVNPSRSSALA